MYIAMRYNVFFTFGSSVDMKGSAYQLALQHLMVGVYLSEFCLVGLFAIGCSKGAGAAGPLVLEIILFVGTILYHRSLVKAIGKLTISLPNDLLAEECNDKNERDNSVAEKGHQDVNPNNGNMNRAETNSDGSERTRAYQVPTSASLPPQQTGIKGRIQRFLHPNTYASAAVLSKRVLSPHLTEPVRPYTQQERDEAYMHPAMTDETPIIWLARDRYGFSRSEVKDSQRQIGEGAEVTDEGAWFNEKGKVEWDENNATNMPIYRDDRWTGGRDVY